MKHAQASTERLKQLFTCNIMHEHSPSISADAEQSRTYASIGLLGDSGWTARRRSVGAGVDLLGHAHSLQ